MQCTFDQTKLWEANIPAKIEKLKAEIHTCSEWLNTTTLGRINVLKSLFFSRLPYFLELVTISQNILRGLKKFQSVLDNLVWNGKKPKLKLQNAAPRPVEGGLGMINVTHRYYAIKIDLLCRVADTTHLQFWQAHLFSHFSVGFDEILTCNLTYRNMQHLMVKKPSLFWREVLDIWCKFHYRGCSHKLNKEQIQEVIARPAYFNSAFGSNIIAKNRWSPGFKEFFIKNNWFVVSDIVDPDSIPVQKYFSRNTLKLLYQSIPSQWRKTEVDNCITIGQKLLNQNLRQRDMYNSLCNRDQDCVCIINKWVKEGCTISFHDVTKNVSKIANGKLKDFYIRFNSYSILLKLTVCHYLNVSDRCSLCKSFKETYLHLFWECPKSQYIWKYVHSLVPAQFHSLEKLLFPTHAPEMVVFLHTFCKYYIYLCKIFNQDTVLPYFKNKLNFHLKALKALYLVNNKEKKFEKNFGNLQSKLNV